MKPFPPPLTVEEIRSLFGMSESLRDTLILRLMYLSLRVSDVLNMRYENIKWKESMAQCKVKGGKIIKLMIDPETLSLLKTYCKENKIKVGRIFKINRTRVYQIVHDLANDAGLIVFCPECGQPTRNVHPHNLRHSFGPHALDGYHLYIPNKLNLRQVQLQLGHEDIRTTAQYLRYTDQARKEAFGIT